MSIYLEKYHYIFVNCCQSIRNLSFFHFEIFVAVVSRYEKPTYSLVQERQKYTDRNTKSLSNGM